MKASQKLQMARRLRETGPRQLAQNKGEKLVANKAATPDARITDSNPKQSAPVRDNRPSSIVAISGIINALKKKKK